MKRAVIAVATLVAALVVPVVAAAPAQARCIPANDRYHVYTISNKSFVYHPGNVYSDWVIFPRGGTISYSQSRTLTVSASMTATVSAEAGAIFAKASTSFGVTVGGSYSKAQTWTYSANIPADATHKYRLHVYHYSVNFTVTKKLWNYTTCNYSTTASGWPQRVSHAPVKRDNNVWRVDRAAA